MNKSELIVTLINESVLRYSDVIWTFDGSLMVIDHNEFGALCIPVTSILYYTHNLGVETQ